MLRELQWFLRKPCAHGLFLARCPDAVVALIGDLFAAQQRLGEEALPQLEAGVLLLLCQLASEARHGPAPILTPMMARAQLAPIEPALLYTAQHYRQEIRMSDLARACAMSESYFRKQFIHLVGQSPLEYVNRYRIHRAVFLLQNTGDTIAAIAQHTGFPSVTTFQRNFQKYEGNGLTPAKWRENHTKR